MSLLDKLFTFDSGTESWVNTDGAKTVGTHDSSDGYSGNGCLKASISGRNSSELDYAIWAWTGTFEDLGVPAGSTVSNVTLDQIYDKIALADTASALSYLINLTDNLDVSYGNLLASTSLGTTTTAWIQRTGSGVTLSDLPSNTTIKLKIVTSLALANSKTAAADVLFDYLDLGITYTLTAPSINITNTPIDKVSDEVGYQTSSVTFQCDQAATQWEARATNELETPGVGVGLLVGSGGAINANTDTPFDVDYTELTGGDRVYTVTVYCYVGGTWYG